MFFLISHITLYYFVALGKNNRTITSYFCNASYIHALIKKNILFLMEVKQPLQRLDPSS